MGRRNYPETGFAEIGRENSAPWTTFPSIRLERSRFAADAFACCWADDGCDL